MYRTSKVLKSVSLILVLSFSLQGFGLAAGEALFLNLPKSDLKLAQRTFKLPRSIGSISDAYLPKQKPLVFLIQDPHANPSGQMNVAKTLDHLLKANSIPYVFIEAGSGNGSLSHYRSYASPAVRRQTGREYLQKALLHGEEYLDINSDHQFTIWGVEDRGLYDEALALYKKVAEDRPRFERYMAKIGVTLRLLENKEYNPILQKLIADKKAHENMTLPFTGYADALLAQHAALNLQSRYPKLEKLREFRNFEESLKRVKNLRQKTALLNRQIQKTLDYDELLKESDALEQELFSCLAVTAQEKILLQSRRTFEFYQKLLYFRMTPNDYKAYQAQGLSPERLTGFLNRHIFTLGDYYENALFLEPGFEEILKSAQDFYELTLKRDRAFVANLMNKATREPSVLIAGGYHAPNLKMLLKEQGFSYVDIVPAITQETNLKRYEKVLLSTKTLREVPEIMRGVVGASLIERSSRRLRSPIYDGEKLEAKGYRAAAGTRLPTQFKKMETLIYLWINYLGSLGQNKALSQFFLSFGEAALFDTALMNYSRTRVPSLRAQIAEYVSLAAPAVQTYFKDTMLASANLDQGERKLLRKALDQAMQIPSWPEPTRSFMRMGSLVLSGDSREISAHRNSALSPMRVYLNEGNQTLVRFPDEKDDVEISASFPETTRGGLQAILRFKSAQNHVYHVGIWKNILHDQASANRESPFWTTANGTQRTKSFVVVPNDAFSVYNPRLSHEQVWKVRVGIADKRRRIIGLDFYRLPDEASVVEITADKTTSKIVRWGSGARLAAGPARFNFVPSWVDGHAREELIDKIIWELGVAFQAAVPLSRVGFDDTETKPLLFSLRTQEGQHNWQMAIGNAEMYDLNSLSHVIGEVLNTMGATSTSGLWKVDSKMTQLPDDKIQLKIIIGRAKPEANAARLAYRHFDKISFSEPQILDDFVSKHKIHNIEIFGKPKAELRKDSPVLSIAVSPNAQRREALIFSAYIQLAGANHEADIQDDVVYFYPIAGARLVESEEITQTYRPRPDYPISYTRTFYQAVRKMDTEMLKRIVRELHDFGRFIGEQEKSYPSLAKASWSASVNFRFENARLFYRPVINESGAVSGIVLGSFEWKKEIEKDTKLKRYEAIDSSFTDRILPGDEAYVEIEDLLFTSKPIAAQASPASPSQVVPARKKVHLEKDPLKHMEREIDDLERDRQSLEDQLNSPEDLEVLAKKEKELLEQKNELEGRILTLLYAGDQKAGSFVWSDDTESEPAPAPRPAPSPLPEAAPAHLPDAHDIKALRSALMAELDSRLMELRPHLELIKNELNEKWDVDPNKVTRLRSTIGSLTSSVTKEKLRKLRREISLLHNNLVFQEYVPFMMRGEPVPSPLDNSLYQSWINNLTLQATAIAKSAPEFEGGAKPILERLARMRTQNPDSQNVRALADEIRSWRAEINRETEGLRERFLSLPKRQDLRQQPELLKTLREGLRYYDDSSMLQQRIQTVPFETLFSLMEYLVGAMALSVKINEISKENHPMLVMGIMIRLLGAQGSIEALNQPKSSRRISDILEKEKIAAVAVESAYRKFASLTLLQFGESRNGYESYGLSRLSLEAKFSKFLKEDFFGSEWNFLVYKRLAMLYVLGLSDHTPSAENAETILIGTTFKKIIADIKKSNATTWQNGDRVRHRVKGSAHVIAEVDFTKKRVRFEGDLPGFYTNLATLEGFYEKMPRAARLSDWRPVPMLKGILLNPASGEIKFDGDQPVVALDYESYWVRHGETYASKEKIWQGKTSFEKSVLTEKGRQDAGRAAQLLLQHLKADLDAGAKVIVATSPMPRAKDTAMALMNLAQANRHENIQLVEKEFLAELSMGVLETHQYKNDLAAPEQVISDKILSGSHFLAKANGGESVLDAVLDSKKSFEEFNSEIRKAQSLSPSQKVIVVFFTHGMRSAALRVLAGDRSLQPNPNQSINWFTRMLPTAEPAKFDTQSRSMEPLTSAARLATKGHYAELRKEAAKLQTVSSELKRLGLGPTAESLHKQVDRFRKKLGENSVNLRTLKGFRNHLTNKIRVLRKHQGSQQNLRTQVDALKRFSRTLRSEIKKTEPRKNAARLASRPNLARQDVVNAFKILSADSKRFMDTPEPNQWVEWFTEKAKETILARFPEGLPAGQYQVTKLKLSPKSPADIYRSAEWELNYCFDNGAKFNVAQIRVVRDFAQGVAEVSASVSNFELELLLTITMNYHDAVKFLKRRLNEGLRHTPLPANPAMAEALDSAANVVRRYRLNSDSLAAVAAKLRKGELSSYKDQDLLSDALRSLMPGARLAGIQHLLELEHGKYPEAVLDHFVRSDREDAVAYLAAQNSRWAYAPFLQRIYDLVGDLKGKTVVELGAGPGVMVENLRRLGRVDAIGIESNSEYVEFAEQHGVPLFEGDLLEVPKALKGKQFDVTFSHWFLDVLSSDKASAFKPISREKKLQILSTVAALTAPGGWSIHVTAPKSIHPGGEISFTNDELKNAGFDIIEENKERTFVALRKKATPNSSAARLARRLPVNLSPLSDSEMAAMKAIGSVAQRIDFLRMRANMTDLELSLKIGYKTNSALSLMKHSFGEWFPSDDNLDKLAAAFQIQWTDLMDETLSYSDILDAEKMHRPYPNLRQRTIRYFKESKLKYRTRPYARPAADSMANFALRVFDSTRNTGVLALVSDDEVEVLFLQVQYDFASRRLVVSHDGKTILATPFRGGSKLIFAPRAGHTFSLREKELLGLPEISARLQQTNGLLRGAPAELRTQTPKIIRLNASRFIRRDSPHQGQWIQWFLASADTFRDRYNAIVVLDKDEQGISSKIIRAADKNRSVFEDGETLPFESKNVSRIDTLSPDKASEYQDKGICYLFAMDGSDAEFQNIALYLRLALLAAEVGAENMKPGNVKFMQFLKIYEAFHGSIQDPEGFARFSLGIIALGAAEQFALRAVRVESVLRATVLAARMARQSA